MFNQCYNNCEIVPLHLLADKSCKRFQNNSKTISLKQSPKRSLKFLKTQTTLNGKRDSRISIQSPRLSLHLSPQVQRNTQSPPHPSLTERFFYPCNLNNFSSLPPNNYFCQQIRIQEQRRDPFQNSIKIKFNYDKNCQKIVQPADPIEKTENQINQQQTICCEQNTEPENVKTEDVVKLSQISEQKEDILSIEFGKGEHREQQIESSGMQPKLAVSLMNSRYECNSIVLEKPLNFAKLFKLT